MVFQANLHEGVGYLLRHIPNRNNINVNIMVTIWGGGYYMGQKSKMKQSWKR